MTTLFPPIEPYQTDFLSAGDNQRIYYEHCGNPNGKPVLVLHGGPGSGCTPAMRRFFDPQAYRIILFDQRGCGRSRPHASDPNVDLATNTTQNIIEDIEQLRTALSIERWMLYGVSWGSTLGLAYAERHPERVTGIILVGVTTTRRVEIDWLYRGVAPLFPAQWQMFREGVPPEERDGDLVEAYARLLGSPDPGVREKAARDFHDWEAASVSIDLDAKPDPRWADPDFRMARARIVTHYFRHNAFLEDGILLREAGRLVGIPGVLIQGRLDLSAPLLTAWELSRAWPGSELVIVQGAGHASKDPGMTEAILSATNRFARLT